MGKTCYYRLPGFEAVYLEDSYVLDIRANADSVDIFLDAVLTEQHAQYITPKPTEQYCYRSAHIYFSDVKKVTWVEKSMTPYKDPNGEVDYGNIDTFYFADGHYHLAGDWGVLDIVSPRPRFELCAEQTNGNETSTTRNDSD